MKRRILSLCALALLGASAACGGVEDDPETEGWSREELQVQGSELIEERSGDTVGLVCNEALSNDPTVLIACKGSDGQQYVFTVTDDGELEVLINDLSPSPEADEPG